MAKFRQKNSGPKLHNTVLIFEKKMSKKVVSHLLFADTHRKAEEEGAAVMNSSRYFNKYSPTSIKILMKISARSARLYASVSTRRQMSWGAAPLALWADLWIDGARAAVPSDCSAFCVSAPQESCVCLTVHPLLLHHHLRLLLLFYSSTHSQLGSRESFSASSYQACQAADGLIWREVL